MASLYHVVSVDPLVMSDGEEAYVNITFAFAHPNPCSAIDTAAAAALNAKLNATMELNKSIFVNMNNEFAVMSECIYWFLTKTENQRSK
jgi:hypothetical protein